VLFRSFLSFFSTAASCSPASFLLFLLFFFGELVAVSDLRLTINFKT